MDILPIWGGIELHVSRLQDRGQKLADTPNYMMVRFRALTFHGSVKKVRRHLPNLAQP